MSRFTDLIAKVKAKDPQLGADLDREFQVLSSRLSFGLNFERHRPEAVELPQRPVRRGDKVRMLPPRGSTARGDRRLWLVKAIDRAKKTAELVLMGAAKAENQTAALDDLIVVAEFRDTIYPGLVSTGSVSRGGDKPWHTVINGENYHVLKALTWTHRGRVDAIYIDPPYNTRDKDWKYNNDYVNADDLYRHSKWLAMMERRLLVAKELLNPADSVLIVTIDEKEYLRLGLLLDQIFPEAAAREAIQMVTSVINSGGPTRLGRVTRVDEYLFFVMFGKQRVVPTGESMLTMSNEGNGKAATKTPPAIWHSLLRGGEGARRQDSKNLFYPVYVNESLGKIIAVGDPIPLDADRDDVPTPKGLRAVWPIRSDHSEGRWRISAVVLREKLAKKHAKLGGFSAETGTYRINYLVPANERRLQTGEIVIVGEDDRGDLILKHADDVSRVEPPKTVWNRQSHNARAYGTDLLSEFVSDRKFPFPKSLYAVEDTLRFFVATKPQAVVLDFFSGSGTTAHAVMRLNKQDGGRRQCISVTNNEVSVDEQKALRERGLRPGDAEWERLGICDYITKPRVRAAITGKTPDGEPIKGDYKFTDEFPMADGFEENAEFFTLTYETPVAVSYQTAFARIAPLLWLRAGSVGRRIDKLPAAGWEVVDTYGLLVELDKATDFLIAARKAKALRIAYIVTDDERRFQALARRLPEGVEAIRLYESYLTNFAFANGDNA
ncbi:MAG TPA: site-specific DNA-methyltransferase [Pyrinomonadaceae bacterium]|nr:site-specific DNA-methyltransferase [Pyrinomonadaceae bacterium]